MVLTVALIAVARHVIDMDLNTAEPLNLVGTGVVVITLSLGYFYFKKAKAYEQSADIDEGLESTEEPGGHAVRLLIEDR